MSKIRGEGPSDVAALVTALTGLLGLCLGFFGLPAVVTPPTAIQPSATVTVPGPTVTVTQGGTDQSGGGSTGGGHSPSVEWQGPVIIPGGGASELSLDENPPTHTMPGDVWFFDDQLEDDNNGIAAWNKSGVPTEKQCGEMASTESVQKITARAGLIVCLKTFMDARTAMITVKKVDASGDGSVQADVIVWAN